jgi:hypothetical protein
VSGALINVLNIASPDQLAALIAEEKAYLAQHSLPPVARSHIEYVLEADGETVPKDGYEVGVEDEIDVDDEIHLDE